MEQFHADLDDAQRRASHIEDDGIADGHRNGVTGTPTIFIDGIRYDGASGDFYSLLEALDRPIGCCEGPPFGA